MNVDRLSFHLREASEELARTIAEIETNPDLCEIELKIAFEHLYNHLNTAWNSRNVGDGQISAHSREEFYTWRAFPSDIDMANGLSRSWFDHFAVSSSLADADWKPQRMDGTRDAVV